MTSKCGNLKKSGTQGAAKFVSDVHTTFLCLLLLKRPTATWSSTSFFRNHFFTCFGCYKRLSENLSIWLTGIDVGCCT